MVDMALSNIVNWFFTSYMKMDYPNENLFKILEINESASMDFQIDTKFELESKFVSVKFKSTTTFQEILNTLYDEYLYERVNPYTYGIDWIIQIQDDKRLYNLNKEENPDLRLFQLILSVNWKEQSRLIISCCS